MSYLAHQALKSYWIRSSRESFGRSCGLPTRSVGPTVRSTGLLVGRTHLSGTIVSLVGGDPGVPMSHTERLTCAAAAIVADPGMHRSQITHLHSVAATASGCQGSLRHRCPIQLPRPEAHCAASVAGNGPIHERARRLGSEQSCLHARAAAGLPLQWYWRREES
jgi:hypothetical protein